LRFCAAASRKKRNARRPRSTARTPPELFLDDFAASLWLAFQPMMLSFLALSHLSG
jgi:hypothetical protein